MSAGQTKRSASAECAYVFKYISRYLGSLHWKGCAQFQQGRLGIHALLDLQSVWSLHVLQAGLGSVRG